MICFQKQPSRRQKCKILKINRFYYRTLEGAYRDDPYEGSHVHEHFASTLNLDRWYIKLERMIILWQREKKEDGEKKPRSNDCAEERECEEDSTNHFSKFLFIAPVFCQHHSYPGFVAHKFTYNCHFEG